MSLQPKFNKLFVKRSPEQIKQTNDLLQSDGFENLDEPYGFSRSVINLVIKYLTENDIVDFDKYEINMYIPLIKLTETLSIGGTYDELQLIRIFTINTDELRFQASGCKLSFVYLIGTQWIIRFIYFKPPTGMGFATSAIGVQLCIRNLFRLEYDSFSIEEDDVFNQIDNGEVFDVEPSEALKLFENLYIFVYMHLQYVDIGFESKQNFRNQPTIDPMKKEKARRL